MLGACESYLGAFAVELGHGASALAILVTAPLLAGAVSQLFSVPLVSLLGSRKRLVVGGAALQGLSIGMLVYIADAANRSLWFLLGAKLLFWMSGSMMAPAWGDWIGALTRRVSRARYFGMRSAFVNATLLLSFSGAGVFIHSAADQPLDAFALLFSIGLFARLSSAVTLAFHRAVAEPAAQESLWQRIRGTWRAAEWRVAVYLAGLYFGAHVSVPFFTPYMLRELSLDYLAFAGLSAVSILTKVVLFPFAHLLAARVSLRRLLTWSGLGIALVPLAWTLSNELWWLSLVHILSGAVWAGLEYTSFQILLDAAPTRLRTEFLALANCLAGSAQLLGALAGAQLLSSNWLSYAGVFELSSVLRAIPLALLIVSLPRWFRPPLWAKVLYMRLLSVRPSAGPSQRPISSTADTPVPGSSDDATARRDAFSEEDERD